MCASTVVYTSCWSLVSSRMASSGGDGHRHARSQTMPIIRSKNALTNPKLLQMMETGNTCMHTFWLKWKYSYWRGVESFNFDPDSVSRRKYSGWGHPESYRYWGKPVHWGGPHCAGCTGALCSPSQGSPADTTLNVFIQNIFLTWEGSEYCSMFEQYNYVISMLWAQFGDIRTTCKCKRKWNE